MQADINQLEFIRHSRYPLEARRASFSQPIFKKHYHDTYAIGMVEDGASRFSWMRAGCLVQPGAVVLLNPGEVHVCNSLPDSTWTYRMIYLEPAWVADSLSPAEFTARVVTQPALYHSLCRLYESLKNPLAVLENDCLLTESLSLLFEKYGSMRQTKSGAQPSLSLREARAYLMDHLCENIPLQQLSAVAGLSSYHLLRSFRQAYGVPPHTYQNLQRIQRARRLINRGSEPLSRLALSLGFSDQSHFTRVFKESFGISPGRYQQICRQID